jgi:hypothetical protein
VAPPSETVPVTSRRSLAAALASNSNTDGDCIVRLPAASVPGVPPGAKRPPLRTRVSPIRPMPITMPLFSIVIAPWVPLANHRPCCTTVDPWVAVPE